MCAYRFLFFPLGHKAPSAISLEHAPNQGGKAICMQSLVSGDSLNLFASLLLTFITPALWIEENLK